MKRKRIASWIALIVCASSLEAQIAFNQNPTRVVGQPSLTLRSTAPNVVEGRELFSPQSLALDFSVTPPGLYVADTGNNRVLGWRNAAQFANGAFADVIIGQPDRFSTTPLGPGSRLSTGLSAPTGLAVDSEGNLYVVDTGNNRILRFPKPFEQPDELKRPDMVIGQRGFDANLPNEGAAAPTAATIAVNTSRGLFRTALAFDEAGNLWFSDSGNHRVLRYPAAALAAGSRPAADLVLGRFDFTSVPTADELRVTIQNRENKALLNTPSGLAFDHRGRLYVSDLLNRVLVFVPPFRQAMAAARIMGVVQPGQADPAGVNDTGLRNPEGVLAIGPNPAVVDRGNHRILIYDAFDAWPAEEVKFSPAARSVIGQTDMVSAKAATTSSGLSSPTQAVFSGSELFVADSGNNRVLVFPQASTIASRVLGQLNFDQGAANLVEGKEMYLAVISGTSLLPGGGVVVDAGSNPPRLYVADTFNHRVLGYKDARKVKPGDAADLIIGQPNGFSARVNYPSNDPNQPSESGLFLPIGLAVDASGNLWVADSGNSRVLRFPKPSFDGRTDMPRANLVLGQATFFAPKNTDPTSRTMGAPYGLAFSPEGHLFVSDSAHNRVLLFLKPATGDFTNGMAASAHFGQPDFLSSSAGSADNRFNTPRGIAVDTSGRLYVADSRNNRIPIYAGAAQVRDEDPRPAQTLTSSTAATTALRAPHSVFVSPVTGEIWVAETTANRVLRYPEFQSLPATNFTATAILPSVPGPLAVTLDGFGNPIVAESANRVSLFFPRAVGRNAANYVERLAPGMYVALFPSGGQFAFEETKVFDELPNPIPMPRELADIQVLVNDQPAPLHFVSPRQINFFMPMNAPTQGNAEVVILRPSTGQIIASGPVPMDVASPGLFTANASGSGQLAALNQNDTPNSPSNPAAQGEVIQLFATGQGFVANAPPDGETPGGRLIPTEEKPRVWIGASFVDDADVQYSGLAPSLIGVWQINVKIPDRVAPGPSVLVFVQIKDRNSQPSPQMRGTIAVKQR